MGERGNPLWIASPEFLQPHFQTLQGAYLVGGTETNMQRELEMEMRQEEVSGSLRGGQLKRKLEFKEMRKSIRTVS